jgi:hypothetical protein
MFGVSAEYKNKLYVERRDASGALVVKGRNHPLEGKRTEDELCNAYFTASEHDRPVATQKEVEEWVASLGLSVRAYTW